MTYIEENLLKDEIIQHEAKVSLWSFFVHILFGIVLLPVYGLGLLIFLYIFITYKTTELAITNKRIVAKFGFISRDTIEIKLDKVESVQVNQGIFGRIFGFGSIIVSGAGNPQAPVPRISDPIKFRSKVFEVQES